MTTGAWTVNVRGTPRSSGAADGAGCGHHSTKVLAPPRRSMRAPQTTAFPPAVLTANESRIRAARCPPRSPRGNARALTRPPMAVRVAPGKPLGEDPRTGPDPDTPRHRRQVHSTGRPHRAHKMSTRVGHGPNIWGHPNEKATRCCGFGLDRPWDAYYTGGPFTAPGVRHASDDFRPRTRSPHRPHQRHRCAAASARRRSPKEEAGSTAAPGG